MKMVKSLLLGSAAGVAAVAGAQAADLPVKAAPVQYVKICTLYGDGFYYIPGSDTCIRFSGYIRSDYGWNVTGARTPHYSGAAGAQDRSVARHSTRHRGSFAIDTRTQTAYGTLRTFQQIHVSNENEGTIDTQISRAFIQWGGFTFGHTNSFTTTEGSLGDGGMRSLHQVQNQHDRGANGTNQIAYTWQLGNGVTFNIGADERLSKNLSNLSATGAISVGNNPSNFRHGNTAPDPWVALRVSQAWGRASIAFVGHLNQATYYSGATPGFVGCAAQPGSSQCDYPDDRWGWAVVGGTEINLSTMLTPGSRLGLFGLYGQGAVGFSGGNNLSSPGLYGSGNRIAFGFVTDAVYVTGSDLELTTAWTVGGGFEYFWTRNFSSTVYGAFTEVSYNSNVVNNGWFCSGGGAAASGIGWGRTSNCYPGFNYWIIGTHHDWFPLPGLRLAVDVMYNGIDTANEGGLVTLTTKQGNRPTGVYTAKNLGITSVIFRAQRTWGAGG
jgi:hypothetical protein